MEFVLVDENYEEVKPGQAAILHFESRDDFKVWLEYLRATAEFANKISGYWDNDEFINLQ